MFPCGSWVFRVAMWDEARDFAQLLVISAASRHKILLVPRAAFGFSTTYLLLPVETRSV